MQRLKPAYNRFQTNSLIILNKLIADNQQASLDGAYTVYSLASLDSFPC